MLKTLHISNYALIDSVDIEFNDGFNIITGETGAGESSSPLTNGNRGGI